MRLVARLARLAARLARLEIAEIEKYFSNPYNRHILSVLRDFSRVSIYHSLSLFITLRQRKKRISDLCSVEVKQRGPLPRLSEDPLPLRGLPLLRPPPALRARPP